VAVIEFRVLGPLEIERDGAPVEVAGQRQRALLAALLVRANHVVPTDRLVHELWGDEPPRTANTSLHNAVSQLRRVLGDDVLVTRAPGYVLRADAGQVDASRFEAALRDAREREPGDRARVLRGALALWRGPAYAEVADEPYAEAEARRLDELHVVALEERIDADLALGAHDAVVAELEALIAEHPLRERLRGQVMLALYRAGRQADALQAYAAARRTLVDELGIEPGPALQRLHADILRQDRSLEPAAGAPDVDDHFADVVRALLAARLVAVVGPDVAISGRRDGDVWRPEAAAVAPSDAELAAHLATTFECPPGPETLPRVSQHVAVTHGVGPLYDELHDLLGVDYAAGPVQRFLAWLPSLLRERGLPYQLIVTTNLDATIERAFLDAGEPLDVVSYIAAGRDRGKFLHVAHDGTSRVVADPNADAGIDLGRSTVLLRLHGRVDPDVARDHESFVVSEDDYIDYLAHAELASVVPVTLAAKLRRSHFLFLGYGLQEWNLRVFLRRVWGSDRVDYRSWAVHPGPEAIVRELWRARGVETFDVALDEYVDELRRRIEERAR
jgi:DNA-binding SARP family transcriptional activator